MKKIMSLCLTFIMFFAVAGCGSNETEKTPEGTDDVANAVTIDEQVIYDKDGVKITVYGEAVKDDFGNLTIPLKVENNNGKDITVSSNAMCSVNGMMAMPTFLVDVKNGETIEGELKIEAVKIKGQIINAEPKKIELATSIWVGHDFEETILSFTTNSKKEPEMLIKHYEQVVAENDQVKVSVELNKDKNMMDMNVNFIIENKTDKVLTYSNFDLIFNDKVIPYTNMGNIMPNATFSDVIEVYENDFTNVELNIEDINNFKTNIELKDKDSEESVLESNEVNIEVKEIIEY